MSNGATCERKNSSGGLVLSFSCFFNDSGSVRILSRSSPPGGCPHAGKDDASTNASISSRLGASGRDGFTAICPTKSPGSVSSRSYDDCQIERDETNATLTSLTRRPAPGEGAARPPVALPRPDRSGYPGKFTRPVTGGRGGGALAGRRDGGDDGRGSSPAIRVRGARVHNLRD